ncbi:SDR family oxidoreductase [Nitratireductor thuwali]|uniref:3-oxoacyl-[acyl-carrier-protein] reductase FabG n=1 Tax=Nitratireductor thuwali TaxID=2267699 RepID=A0ABY5MBR8_9HYPH|nr:3-oxoacyl-[acyl-carrier-protein] reductase FabG [Nitratireductor thuwali]UUP19622.1 3-oxoacyl-[acyl-carrier-protein] reductase FabG [Nitratireductor thuwali]
MDLGISGKNAIVCASSRGLGRGCAMALAEAGCRVVVNGRSADSVKRTAEEIRDRFSAEVAEVIGDVAEPAVQKALLAACPAPDILVNNNGGPPRRDFRELTREAMLDGVTQNMVVPLELIQAVVDGMAERGFGRIVNITSLSVYMPIEGLDLSSGARAGLTAFLAGVSRTVASSNVTINNILPGKMDTERLQGGIRRGAETSGMSVEQQAKLQMEAIPAKRFGTAEEFGKACAFLCSSHAGYITGQNLILDGGLYTSAF